jgi:hypothetical protein
MQISGENAAALIETIRRSQRSLNRSHGVVAASRTIVAAIRKRAGEPILKGVVTAQLPHHLFRLKRDFSLLARLETAGTFVPGGHYFVESAVISRMAQKRIKRSLSC